MRDGIGVVSAIGITLVLLLAVWRGYEFVVRGRFRSMHVHRPGRTADDEGAEEDEG